MIPVFFHCQNKKTAHCPAACEDFCNPAAACWTKAVTKKTTNNA